jgi:cytochrome c peroxidase
MFTKTFRVSYIIILMLFNACGNDSSRETTVKDPLLATARAVFMYNAQSDFYSAVSEYTLPEELGKMLYYDPRLSKSGFISCNSCHNLATFGADRLALSPGHEWRTGRRNSPTVLNAYMHVAQFWDGREATVESQALQPMINPEEMAMSDEQTILAVVKAIPEYVDMLTEVYPGENPVTIENISNAIGAFERTLVTPAPIHNYLAGKPSALTTEQYDGLQEFITVGCATCHTSELLGGKSYAQFLPAMDAKRNGKKDLGRFEFTGEKADMYFFKVPSLLNVVHTYPYFHDGSIWDLKEAIRLIALSQLELDLTNEQVETLAVFMTALSGEVSEWARIVPVLPEPVTPVVPDLY